MESSGVIYTAKLEGDSAFTNGYSGRGNSSAMVAVNDKGEFGFLDDFDGTTTTAATKPYTPVGGRKALSQVKDILIFRPFTWGTDVSIKRGRKL